MKGCFGRKRITTTPESVTNGNKKLIIFKGDFYDHARVDDTMNILYGTQYNPMRIRSSVIVLVADLDPVMVAKVLKKAEVAARLIYYGDTDEEVDLETKVDEITSQGTDLVKLELQVNLYGRRGMKLAFQIASGFTGVQEIFMPHRSLILTVVGYIDPIDMAINFRQRCATKVVLCVPSPNQD